MRLCCWPLQPQITAQDLGNHYESPAVMPNHISKIRRSRDLLPARRMTGADALQMGQQLTTWKQKAVVAVAGRRFINMFHVTMSLSSIPSNSDQQIAYTSTKTKYTQRQQNISQMRAVIAGRNGDWNLNATVEQANGF